MRACFVRGARLPWPLLLLGLVAPCLWPARDAQAEDRRAAALSWVRLAGAESCIDAVSLARRVEERLGRPVFPAPAQATLSVEGRAERAADGFTATLRIYDRDGAALGSRDLSSRKADCAELSETVVLVLAVMIDPDGALAAVPSSTPQATPAPKPVPAPSRPPSTAAPPTARHGPRDLSVFGRAELGSLPGAGFGVGIAAVASFGPLLAFRVEGAGFADQIRRLGGESSSGARFRLLYGTLSYCPLFITRARFGVNGCAGAAVGALQSQPRGLPGGERDQVDPVVNGVAQLRVDLQLVGPVRGVVGASLGTPLVRTLYEITDSTGRTQELFQMGALSASFDLGLAARF